MSAPQKQSIKKELGDIAVELGVLGDKLNLVEARASESHAFKSAKSDAAGRRRELALVLAEDVDHKKLRARQLSLKNRQTELEAQESGLSFNQRNRMVEAMNNLANAVVLLTARLPKEGT